MVSMARPSATLRNGPTLRNPETDLFMSDTGGIKITQEANDANNNNTNDRGQALPTVSYSLPRPGDLITLWDLLFILPSTVIFDIGLKHRLYIQFLMRYSSPKKYKLKGVVIWSI